MFGVAQFGQPDRRQYATWMRDEEVVTQLSDQAADSSKIEEMEQINALQPQTTIVGRLAIHGHERQHRKIQDHERAGGKQDYLQDEDTMTITADETNERRLRLRVAMEDG